MGCCEDVYSAGAERGLSLRLSLKPHDQGVGPSLASTLSTRDKHEKWISVLNQSGAFYHLETFAHFPLSLSVIQINAIAG